MGVNIYFFYANSSKPLFKRLDKPILNVVIYLLLTTYRINIPIKPKFKKIFFSVTDFDFQYLNTKEKKREIICLQAKKTPDRFFDEIDPG